MNLIKKLFILGSLITFNVVSLDAVYEHAIYFRPKRQENQHKVMRSDTHKVEGFTHKKQGAHVFLFGDRPITHDDGDESLALDKVQADYIECLLATCSQGAFIVDASLDETQQALKNYVTVKKECGLNDVHIGLRTRQAFFILGHNESDLDQIHYIFGKYRGGNFQNFIRLFEVLEKKLQSFTFKKGKKLSLFHEHEDQDSIKAKLLKSYGKEIRRQLDTVVPVTVKAFKKELNDLVNEEWVSKVPPLAQVQFRMYVAKASLFVKEFPDETLLRDVVWHTFSQMPLNEIHYALNNWIYRLQSICAQNDLHIAVSYALKHYPIVIISCHSTKIRELKDFLYRNDYYNHMDCSSNCEQNQPVNALSFSHMLDTIHKVVTHKA